MILLYIHIIQLNEQIQLRLPELQPNGDLIEYGKSQE